MSDETGKALASETAPAATTATGSGEVSKTGKKKHQKGPAKEEKPVPVTNGEVSAGGCTEEHQAPPGSGKSKSKKKNKNKANAAEPSPVASSSGAGAAEPPPPPQVNGEAAGHAEMVAEGGDGDGGDGGGPFTSNPDAVDMLMNVREVLERLKVSTRSLKPAKTSEEALHKSYKFWSTQPVPRMDEKILANEPIEEDKPISEIRAEPYALPDGFTWDTMNLNDPLQLKELYTLLNENYVEDDDAMFRFDYQPEFLQWALQPPGWKREWHCGVRVVKSGRLVGFISAIPGTLNVHRKEQRMVEINFLCVHKKLRSKRLAPVLIREITRRVNLTGIFQAVYTAGVVLPKPVSSCRYWHRSLNPKKLIEVKFSYLSRNMTMQRTIKLYKLPDQPKTPGFRKLLETDLKAVHKLLESYLQRFNLTPVFDEAEMRHWFLPQNGIIDCFVVEDPAKPGTITDMVSYYTLPSTVMHHAVHKYVKAAYSFYNVSTRTPWLDLMNDALISAKNLGFDVFNALDLMDNKQFLVPLKFGIGDGNLQYYLYNWRCPSMQPEDVGLILL
ncbi:AGAP001804-PA [Anopheles gambiae str. PEST]|uniref:Glycylpeptide N-tetradecanoyltransferase n=2 Tax=gambiae species complex TaxID=44542 RepID=Q7PY97_ANOGA|nr:glycylpeptide N-tetradecanoyltransferase [Anopheles coluzzii]XP_321256.5 glycylpeptide N-tetradecanoyltransferase [Anopheles gambiae]EAA01164.5 AGAP001804-PA [Anopheles gambiae str. PEST]